MASIAWIRRTLGEVPDFQEIPLFGNAPPFDWSQLQLPLLKIRPGKQGLEMPRKSLAENTPFITIDVAPIGSVYWLMSPEDIAKLASWHLKRPQTSELLQEGFYRYLQLQALEKIQAMAPFETLTLKLGEGELPEVPSFCIDLEISHESESAWGRLVIPPEFKKGWIEHFSRMPTEYIPTELAKQTQLTLGIKTGSVHLTKAEFESIRPGDFVLLDPGSYDAHKGQGVALITLRLTPLFQAKIKQNKIELLDYAFHYQEEIMEKKEDDMLVIKELPVDLTVEIARLKITLDELMHLTPGNTLTLPIHPDQGVSLTIQGQKVGRAELLHLGEKLGIRILEIG